MQKLGTLLNVSGKEIRIRRFMLRVKKEMKKIIIGKKRGRKKKNQNQFRNRKLPREYVCL